MRNWVSFRSLSIPNIRPIYIARERERVVMQEAIRRWKDEGWCRRSSVALTDAKLQVQVQVQGPTLCRRGGEQRAESRRAAAADKALIEL